MNDRCLALWELLSDTRSSSSTLLMWKCFWRACSMSTTYRWHFFRVLNSTIFRFASHDKKCSIPMHLSLSSSEMPRPCSDFEINILEHRWMSQARIVLNLHRSSRSYHRSCFASAVGYETCLTSLVAAKRTVFVPALCIGTSTEGFSASEPEESDIVLQWYVLRLGH